MNDIVRDNLGSWNGFDKYKAQMRRSPNSHVE